MYTYEKWTLIQFICNTFLYIEVKICWISNMHCDVNMCKKYLRKFCEKFQHVCSTWKRIYAEEKKSRCHISKTSLAWNPRGFSAKIRHLKTQYKLFRKNTLYTFGFSYIYLFNGFTTPIGNDASPTVFHIKKYPKVEFLKMHFTQKILCTLLNNSSDVLDLKFGSFTFAYFIF